MKKIIDLVKAVLKEFGEDKVPRMAAALAYYTIFSLAPLLLIIISIVGIVLGTSSGAREQLLGTIGGLIGPDGQKTINDALTAAGSKVGTNILASVIGIITLLLGASGVFGQLKDALNTIWEVKPKEGAGIMVMLRQRFLSFGMVLVVGFLLLISLVVNAALSALGKWLGDALPGGALLWNIVNYIITILIISVMFALMFRFLPDATIGWKDVWIGSFITSVLFLVGQIALGVYLGSGSIGNAWGAGGSIIIILTWIYYSSLILLIGAEFTQAYARMYGSQVKLEPYAESTTEENRGEEGIPHKDGKAVSPGTGDKGHGGQKSRRRTLRTSPWFQ